MKKEIVATILEADALWRAGDAIAAFALLDEQIALAEPDERIALRINRGSIVANTGDHAAAAAYYLEAARLEKADILALFAVMHLGSSSQIDAAEVLAREIIARNAPGYIRFGARMELAELLLDRRDLVRAEMQVRRAIRETAIVDDLAVCFWPTDIGARLHRVGREATASMFIDFASRVRAHEEALLRRNA